MALSRFFHKLTLILFISFVPLVALASIPAWQIVPNESSLTFTGTLNGASTSGQFKTFNGTIDFDPNKLNESHVEIMVDTGSISTSYPDIANTLKMPDWFNVKAFPQAIFKASSFVKTSDKTYQANGSLTIRDKTLPVTIIFSEQESSPNKVHVTGSTTLKRTQFGVGQGEWAETDSVKDEVKIDFNLTAIKK